MQGRCWRSFRLLHRGTLCLHLQGSEHGPPRRCNSWEESGLSRLHDSVSQLPHITTQSFLPKHFDIQLNHIHSP